MNLQELLKAFGRLTQPLAKAASLVIISVSISLSVFAQDKEVEVEVYFTKAKDYFNNGNFQDALSNVRSAENTLGETNVNLLCLKIGIFDSLSQSDWSFADSIGEALKHFFAIADKDNSKYYLMTNVSIDIKSRKQRYDDDFEKVKKSASANDFISYNNKYPNSQHAQDLKIYSDRLMDIDNYYKAALNLFGNGDYEGAIQQIYTAENILGSTTPDLLFGKVKIYLQLANNSWKYVDSAQIALDKFFQIADRFKYPADDYNDMKATSADIKSRIQKYNDDFITVKKSSNPDDLQNYITTYSGSRHAGDMQVQLDKLIARKKEDDRKEQLHQEQLAKEEQLRQEQLAREEKERHEKEKIQNRADLKKLYRGMVWGLSLNEGLSTPSFSNYNGSFSGAEAGGVDFSIGYMFSKHIGLFSGLGVNSYSWDYNDFYYTSVSTSAIYLSVPLIFYYNTSSGKHRAGFYLEAGVVYNSFITASNSDNSTVNPDDYNKSVISTYFSGGLSIRSKYRKGTFLLGVYYKSFGDLFTADVSDGSKLSAYGMKVAWSSTLKRGFKRKYRHYMSNI